MLHLYDTSNLQTNPLFKNDEQQTSHSSHQLHRYNHESVSTNFFHRDIPPIIILLVFLFLIILVLSQILVVHTSRHDGTKIVTTPKIQESRKMILML